jgi:DNA-binding transcriptional ArsR family regulator
VAARQAGTTGSARETRVRPTRPPVRDFTGVDTPTFAVEWDVRSAYDFLISLSSDTGKSEDLPAPDREWLKSAIASLPKDAARYLAGEHQSDLLVHLGSYLVERPEARTAAQAADTIAAAKPAELFRVIAMYAPDEEHDDIGRALAGDREAAAAVKARLKGPKTQALRSILDDPAAAHGQIARVLQAWAVAFAEIEPRVTSILERDVELRAGDRSSLSGVELVEKTTNGIRFVPDPTVERVILAPSYFARPFNYLFAGSTWRFDGYPVLDEALEVDPLAPPASVLRLHRALGDAMRLRILKALAEKDLYGAELAAQLDISKPTVSHHMAQLRAAGLVTAVQAGSAVYYSLRRERVQDALTDLTRFLVG